MFIIRFSLAFIVFVLLLASSTLNASVRTYATEHEILEMSFSGAEIKKKKVNITPEMRIDIEKFIKGKFFKRRVYFYVAKRGRQTQGYATVMNEIGKTEPITFMVILNREGVVKSVNILVFRETQGYEIENPMWRKQFIGKSLKDPLRLKKNIDNISGATLSSRAVTKGVKKVLAVFNVVKPFLEE